MRWVMLLAACAFWHAVARPACAALPVYMTVEGHVERGGEAFSGAALLDVRIYDVPSGGLPRFEQTGLPIEVLGGRFFTEVGGQSLSDALGFGVRWIELTVDGETLAPRRPLSAVPLTLWARRLADDGLAFDELGRRLGVGINPPQAALDVQGQLRLRDPAVQDDMLLVSDAQGYAHWQQIFSVRPGMIAVWSGDAASVPTGWAVCDGQYGTPDLRDRFVVGAGGTLAVGATGGAETHTHAVDVPSVSTDATGGHGHTVDIASFNTSSDGAHTHSIDFPGGTLSWQGDHQHSGGSLSFHAMHVIVDYPGNRNDYINPLDSAHSDTRYGLTWYGGTGWAGGHNHTVDVGAFASGSGGSHSHSIDPAVSAAGAVGDHTHTVDPGAFSSAQASSAPPYYALLYIMKL